MGFLIRPARDADREALLAQTLGLNRFEHAIAGDRRTDEEGARETLDHVLGRIADSQGHAVVAEADGAVVGHLFLTFGQHLPFVAEREHGYVADLFVRESHRGHGIGRALLAEAERLTKARGLKRLLIGVLAGNDGAEATYKRFGFAHYAHEMIKKI
ncbi:GNAT family N-acetyltransferase [Pseudoroseomonas cervicalis]|uniref:GNAT family N-acetyltransferase n=1 Tax=Teichococcus cervicalis TaxID=204525 RepID=UPI002789AD2B|nr:GNAT family N-acetyltransferase [Pseudoroseomonas cervicalis]MDQ1078313.1 GNAT superfamily N-acetyltransferase [Pseudoroseomonas cervicalis]